MHLDRLMEVSARFLGKDADNIKILPKITLYRRDEVSKLEAVIYEPLVCLILQGSKRTSIGNQHETLQSGDALLVSQDLPVVSAITKATVQEPYIALILSLDLNELRSLSAQVGRVPAPHGQATPLSCAPADPAWLAPLTRYLEMSQNPRDAMVLGPSVLREIHYRLLLSPIGQALRPLLVAESHASRIGQAIAKLRDEFRVSVAVSDLATVAGMSVSSFHKHFKSVTGVTPVQYQKDLRLIEARALLVERAATVGEAAYGVGYESPTHFSRDYRRKFGVAPSRDAINLPVTRDGAAPAQ